MPDTLSTYRMTPDEYDRYLRERDLFAHDLGTGRTMALFVANPGKWLVDPTHGSTLYDLGEGFYWVRTTRPVDWM